MGMIELNKNDRSVRLQRDSRILIRAYRGNLDIHRDAHAPQLSFLRGQSALAFKILILGEFQSRLEATRVIPFVIDDPACAREICFAAVERQFFGWIRFRRRISARSSPSAARRLIEQPLHHQRGLRSSRAAQNVERHLIRDHGEHARIEIRNAVRAANHRSPSR